MRQILTEYLKEFIVIENGPNVFEVNKERNIHFIYYMDEETFY